ncbi:MAG: 50S ribosomal protein L6, partial [Thiomonas sp.]
MSRIAKYPVQVPAGVEVNLTEDMIAVKGGLGKLQRAQFA